MYGGGSQFVNRISDSSRKNVRRGFAACQSYFDRCTEGGRNLLNAFLIAPVRMYGEGSHFVIRIFISVRRGVAIC